MYWMCELPNTTTANIITTTFFVAALEQFEFTQEEEDKLARGLSNTSIGMPLAMLHAHSLPCISLTCPFSLCASGTAKFYSSDDFFDTISRQANEAPCVPYI